MDINELLAVTISNDLLKAEVVYHPTHTTEIQENVFTKEEILHFLKDNKVIYGLLMENIEKLIQKIDINDSPMLIAEGINKEDGLDGEIDYAISISTEVDHSFSGDFKDVMRLPVVDKNMKIASLIPPTKGKNGMTITGKEIKAHQGKMKLLRAGKNIHFNEDDQSFYASKNGLVSFHNNSIHICTVYEVNETLSMRTGNIDFNGSVIIRGDVPSGYTVRATGDVNVFGLIEAANIYSGGSVYVSEGISGLKKGVIEAGEDIFIGYVNQGIVRAGRDIHVENSILHSDCSARTSITCYRGNIIGGTLFAGQSIEAKNIGNHMHTTTTLVLGMENRVNEEKEQHEKEKETLRNNIDKIKMIQKKMKQTQSITDVKMRINLLKLTNSQQEMEKRLEEVDDKIKKINLSCTAVDLSDVKVSRTIYPNTTISFGKYQRKIDKDFTQAIVKLVQNDIIIEHYHL